MKMLSEAGREELALALLLWKDFKSGGKLDVQIFKQARELAEHIGVAQEFDNLLSKVPPMKIEPRTQPIP